MTTKINLEGTGPVLAVAQDVFFRRMLLVQRDRATMVVSNGSSLSSFSCGFQSQHLIDRVLSEEGVKVVAHVSGQGDWSSLFAAEKKCFVWGTPESFLRPALSILLSPVESSVPSSQILGLRSSPTQWAVETERGVVSPGNGSLKFSGWDPTGRNPIILKKEDVATLEQLCKGARVRQGYLDGNRGLWLWVVRWNIVEVYRLRFTFYKLPCVHDTLHTQKVYSLKLPEGWEFVDAHPYLLTCVLSRPGGDWAQFTPTSEGFKQSLPLQWLSKTLLPRWTRLGMRATFPPHGIQGIQTFEDAWGKNISVHKTEEKWVVQLWE